MDNKNGLSTTVIGVVMLGIIGLLSACGGSGGGGTTLAQMGGSLQGNPLVLANSVSTLAGTAGVMGSVDGTGTARFKFPFGITTDGANLYVSDTYNHTIRKIVIATGAVTTVAGSAGVSGITDGTAARFDSPYGITTDGANLYVSDTNNHTIRRIQ